MSDIINQSEQMEKYFYRICSNDLKKIPGSPIAYWAGMKFLDVFSKFNRLENRALKGLDTNGNIELFLKRWHEIDSDKFKPLEKKSDKWYPIAKGGEFRRWYGNNDFAINYESNGTSLKHNKANLRSQDKYFLEGLSWTVVSSGGFAVRYLPAGSLFDQGGSAIFLKEHDDFTLEDILGSLNSGYVNRVAKLLCPTLNFTTGDVRKFPIMKDKAISRIARECLNLSKQDWDTYETSWDFNTTPFLYMSNNRNPLSVSYQCLRSKWQDMTTNMLHLEEENNRIFVDTYGLENELSPKVHLRDITLTCNPYYRYDSDKSEEELESLLLSDTMKELISYGVGCIFGRYSLDKPGLILANQGDGMNEYLKEIPSPSFPIDDDNIIPVLEDDYFTDDIASRFVEFIKVAFGEEHHTENIRFIEDAIGKSIRKYFVKGFYDDHIKRYKKRPIYWMVSSPKKSFNALIYMHRYQDDIFARVQNNYLREYITKLEAAMHTATTIANDESNSAADRRKATKDIETIMKKIDELIKFDRDKLTPFAQNRTPIDLDDGVKVNYCKFEEILYPIPGLSE